MNTKINNSRNQISLFRCLFIFVYLTSIVSPLLAQGNLLVFPKRVVFDGKKKTEKLVLSNTGTQTATYNISFVEYKMNENGEMKKISEPEEGILFASPNVRIFPRKVVLGPNEGQTIKLQITDAQNLRGGEYRSHIYFRAEEEQAALGETPPKKSSTISAKLTPVFGISIPCIILVGDNTTTVSISDLQYSKSIDKENILQFKLNRNGNMSLYGDFAINYIATDGKSYEVAKMKGVGVYTPNLYRKMQIKLNQPDNVLFKGGNFKVIYLQNESKKVLTEANLKL